jgi:hypothetical protein
VKRLLSPRYAPEFWVIVALYVVLYGSMLVATHGVPYVTDGNESFSMLVHASNLYHFPFSRTFGLTDEAFSPSPSAHPYVYTHQGNFPRLFSFVWYVLGARGIESQIVITTFTIGLLSVWLIYNYFRTVTNRGFALVATSVFLTDYILFAQWQVNTYRVWHGLFFFLSLVCIHGLDGNRRRMWLLATFVVYACLFYFELVFGAYVAIVGGLYAGVRYWRRPKDLALCWTAQFAGAVTAVVVLCGQLVAHLGWADFLQDLRLTYTARNVGGANQAYVDSIRDFVDSRHLVFWYNFAREYHRSAFEILASVTRGYFNAYTPTLWYLVSIVTLGWLGGMCFEKTPASSDVNWWRHARGSGWPGAVPMLLLLVAWSRFLLAIVQPGALNGVNGSRLLADVNDIWPVPLAAIAGAGCVALLTRVATRRWFGLLNPTRTVVAAVIVLVAEQVVLNGADLFDPSLQPLWSQIQGAWFTGWVVQLFLVGAAAFASGAVLVPGALGETRWPELASYFVCGALAYVIVYMLSPGYLETGYLERLVPFASFVFETAIALMIYLAWSMLRRLWTSATPVAIMQTPLPSLATTGALFSLLLVAGYWVNVQIVHISLLPPTDFMFIRQLGNPPFRGASFAVNTYAAPIYAYTGEWAYFDFRMGDKDGGTVTVDNDGYHVTRDATKYLWLADRQRNAEYQRPDYFLCYQHQDLHTAVTRLTNGRREGCSYAGPVRYAGDRAQPSVAQEVVARDESGRDSWAIVKLDWGILNQRMHRHEVSTEP